MKEGIRLRKIFPATLLTTIMMFSLLTIASASELDNQIKEYELDPIVVTATKTEKKISEVSASVTVITAEDIKKLGATSIDQALIMTPGIYIARLNGMASTTSQIAMRGLSSANSTLVMVDGIPMNETYSGNVVWSSIPVANVEKIEIVRGSASTLYGSGAMAGVVNIITKTPQNSAGSVSIRYGSNDSWDKNFQYGIRVNDKVSMDLFYENKHTDGYITDQVLSKTKPAGSVAATTDTTGATRYIIGDKGKRQWDEENVGFKFNYQLDKEKSLKFTYFRNNHEYTYSTPNSYIGDNVFASNKISTYFATPGETTTNRYAINYVDTKNALDITAGFNDVTEKGNTAIAKKEFTNNPNDRMFFDAKKNIEITEKDLLTVGIHYDKSKIRAKVYNLADGFNPTSITSLKSFANGDAESWALYLRNEHSVNKKWLFGTGLRFDSWSVNGQVNEVSYKERSFTQTSPSVSLQYKADEKTMSYLSWGKAFEAPSLYRMFSKSASTPYNYGNPDLKPQESETIELGIKHKLKPTATMSLAAYHTDYTNLLAKQTINSSNESTYINAGKAEANGFEIEYREQVSNNLSCFANYTYQHSVIKDSSEVESINKLITGVPKKVFRLGTTYHKDKFTGTITGEYASKRWSNDKNTDVVNNVYTSYDPYFIVNLNMKYDINKDTSLIFGIDNLLDRQYFNYYNAPDRSYYVELTHKI